jgi:hypothetical protein
VGIVTVLTNLFWLLAQTVQNFSLKPPVSWRSPLDEFPLAVTGWAWGCAMVEAGRFQCRGADEGVLSSNLGLNCTAFTDLACFGVKKENDYTNVSFVSCSV